eukprot:349583-Chlamydomonas_euryale.AAC.4
MPAVNACPSACPDRLCGEKHPAINHGMGPNYPTSPPCPWRSDHPCGEEASQRWRPASAEGAAAAGTAAAAGAAAATSAAAAGVACPGTRGHH